MRETSSAPPPPSLLAQPARPTVAANAAAPIIRAVRRRCKGMRPHHPWLELPAHPSARPHGGGALRAIGSPTENLNGLRVDDVSRMLRVSRSSAAALPSPPRSDQCSES